MEVVDIENKVNKFEEYFVKAKLRSLETWETIEVTITGLLHYAIDLDRDYYVNDFSHYNLIDKNSIRKNSLIKDIDKKYLYEGDIIECYVKYKSEFIKGQLIFSDYYKSYIIFTPIGKIQLKDVIKIKYIGSSLLKKDCEILDKYYEEIIKKDDEKGYVDNSDCRSDFQRNKKKW